MTVRILTGDCRSMLASLPSESVHCCVTSPPYFGLRSYLPDGHAEKGKEIGLEPTPDEYVAEIVSIFREVRRVLRGDGVLFLNLGDTYAGYHGNKNSAVPSSASNGWVSGTNENLRASTANRNGLKPKDLIGIPWMVAFALRNDGWYLRQWLPWVKRNPMPESTKDRPTSACETIFLLTKSERCFYDYEAVKRRASDATHARLAQNVIDQIGSERANGGAKTNGPMKAVPGTRKQDGHGRRHGGFNERYFGTPKASEPGLGIKNNTSMDAALAIMPETRALRNSDAFFDSLSETLGAITDDDGAIIALDVTTQGFSEAHFATFPPKLIEPLIKAGCPKGGAVLDPFGGAGTTGLVADRLGRDAILIELNPEYAAMAEKRIRGDATLFADVQNDGAPA